MPKKCEINQICSSHTAGYEGNIWPNLRVTIFIHTRPWSVRETDILLPNNQRQHRTSHAPKDVLPLRIWANYCAPCQVSQQSRTRTGLSK